MRHWAWLALLSISLAMYLTGCGGGDSSSLTGVGAPGSLRLLLADAPPAGVSAVNVEITRIALLYDGVEDSLPIPATDTDPVGTEAQEPEDSSDQVVNLYEGNSVVDLMSLANQPMSALLQLAQVAVPSGHYKQVRLYLGDNSEVVLADGTTHKLTVPSGMLRFPLDIYVSPNELETLVLDFDLARSLKAPTGGHGYQLKPVLHISRPISSGSLTGTLALPAGTELTEPLAVVVQVTPAVGDALTTTVEFEPGDALTGVFYVHGIAAGNATVDILINDQSVLQVPATVTAAQLTNLGVLALPAL